MGRLAALDFSLIIPTYNERENLSALCARLDVLFGGGSFEVIIVDDDSPDGTWTEATRLQGQYGWLRVMRRRDERGLSSAVICGFRAARGHVLAVMDGDLQHDESRLPELLEAAKHADFAVATRRAVGGSVGCWTWSRRLTSATATTLARVIAQVPLSDPLSGFFAIRRELFAALDGMEMQPHGYKILLYLYTKAVQRFGGERLRVREIGYQFRRRAYGKSKLSSRVIVEYLWMLLDLRFSQWARTPRPRFATVPL